MSRPRMLNESFIFLLGHSTSSMQPSDYHTWIHGIYPNSLWRKLQCRTACQLIDASLRNTISQNIWECSRSGYARNVYNISLRLLKEWNTLFHQIKYRTQVDIEHIVPFIQ